MRYTSAVVLSTLAVGQAVAANHHNRHASFHARREAKRSAEPDAEVNWKGVAYDLKDVKWDEVNWSSVFASPAAAATPAPEQKQPSASATPTVVAEAKKEKPTSSIVVATSTQAAQKPAQSSKAAASSTTTPSSGSVLGKIVTEVSKGVADLARELDCKVGLNKNAESDDVKIWIGTNGKWGMDVTNTGNKYAAWYCWQKEKGGVYAGMSVRVTVPDVSVGLDPGETVQLSFAEAVPVACAPAKSGTSLALFGGLMETWAEATFGPSGAFDVSKEVNMQGSPISMKGELCTSDMSTCFFACKNAAGQPDYSQSHCKDGSQYDLFGRAAGCGGGYDEAMAGTGGGCSVKPTGERLKVSFS